MIVFLSNSMSVLTSLYVHAQYNGGELRQDNGAASIVLCGSARVSLGGHMGGGGGGVIGGIYMSII